MVGSNTSLAPDAIVSSRKGGGWLLSMTLCISVASLLSCGTYKTKLISKSNLNITDILVLKPIHAKEKHSTGQL